MRELVYFVAVSLDGQIAGPDGDVTAFPMVGQHIDMIISDYRETLPAVALQAMGLEVEPKHFDTVLMGWGTYEAGLVQGVDDPYPHLRQHVFTRSAKAVPEGIDVSADPASVVRRLKQEPGKGIWLCGGGQLASTVVDQIDRLVLKVNPIVLGQGTPLFSHGYAPQQFALTGSRAYSSGVVVNEYERR